MNLRDLIKIKEYNQEARKELTILYAVLISGYEDGYNRIRKDKKSGHIFLNDKRAEGLEYYLLCLNQISFDFKSKEDYRLTDEDFEVLLEKTKDESLWND